MTNALKLNGGNGNIELLADGTLKVTVTYQLAFGIQLPPGTVIQIEEAFRPNDGLSDSRQMDLLRIADKWKAGA